MKQAIRLADHLVDERNDAMAADIVGRVLKVTICQPFIGFVFYDGPWPVGAAVFNCFTGADIAVTACMKRGFSVRQLRDRMLQYCFGELGVSRITMRTRRSNRAAQAAMRMLGLKFECVAQDHFGDEDAVVMRYLKRDWKR